MKPTRVLVVDDVPEVRAVYQRLFLRVGMEVFTAENGVRALDVIRREAPAVVVTDIDMPEMNGLELCREIRGDAALSAIAVVVLTGGGEQHRAVEAGCHAVLEKPCPRDLLIETVQRVLKRPTASD